MKDGISDSDSTKSNRVKTAEGTAGFKSLHDKTSETVNGSDRKFVGTWGYNKPGFQQ